MLIRRDPVAARWAAAELEEAVGRPLSRADKREAADIMARHNPAVAASLRDLWGL
jgi:hypothetical protein